MATRDEMARRVRDPVTTPESTRVLALIPARGGSRGIPRKNLVEIGGRRLIEWSIEAALSASTVERTVVSTDDDEIADVAVACGAEVPFRRPAELAGDLVPDLPVFQHALAWLATHGGWQPDLVVHLRPTSPARRHGLVDEAVQQLLRHPEADSLRSVSPAPHTPYKMWTFDDGWLMPLLGHLDEELFNRPRQSLPMVWRHDGVIDVVRRSTLELDSMTGRRILGLGLTQEEAADVDTSRDLDDAVRALQHVGLMAPSGEHDPSSPGGM